MHSFAINPSNYWSTNNSGVLNNPSNADAPDLLIGSIFSKFGAGHANKMLLQSVLSEVMLQNQTNCNVKVQLYDIICRRDMTAGTTYYDPNNAWIARR